MTRVRTPEPEGYAEVWELWRPYRRPNDGRGDGRGAYRKMLLNGYEPETIRSAVEYFIAHKRPEPAFMPMFATWLNREPFDDLLADKADADARAARIAALRGQNVMPITAHQKPTDGPTEKEREAVVARLLPNHGRLA